MEIPELNIDIGFHLLKFLYGTDMSNFLEVVNNCRQFLSIATASDRMFVEIMKKNHGEGRILIAPEMYQSYLDDCEVIDSRLVPLNNRNLSVIQPVQRLFLYACFSIEGFGALCRAYRTPLFHCYSRLLPFNTDLYYADFGLVDYELYAKTVSAIRDLNSYEKLIFKSKSLVFLAT